jgi:hypothetical protein
MPQDKATFRHQRASWADIADGAAKCKVALLQPPCEMFRYMPVNDSVVSARMCSLTIEYVLLP